jgi:5-methyltetrahydrofolate--homocysteine methyltransferase
MADLSALAEDLIAGKIDEVKKLTQEALDEGIPSNEILDDGLIRGMSVVGERFKNGEFFIPEVLMAAKAMHAAMDILKPSLVSSGVEPIGKVAIGTVKGDLHDIGKNLVAMMLEGGGFEVMDLGTSVPPEKFVEAAEKGGASIVAMSALLTTSMIGMEATVKALREAGMSDKVKTMVGGAPVTQSFADRIGADGYARNAASAVDKARELLKLLRCD